MMVAAMGRDEVSEGEHAERKEQMAEEGTEARSVLAVWKEEQEEAAQ